jgi:ABC-type glycerol-3-phosphate transport system substrate-binding protein
MPRCYRSILVVAPTILMTCCCGCDGPAGERSTREITVWAHHGQERENVAMRQIVARFNEAHREQGLRVEIAFFPDRQYADKVSIASACRALPDVLDVDSPYVGPWAAEGVLQPIGDLVGDELRRDLLPSLLEQGSYRGELYALGAYDSALVVYYNRDIIEKASLDPPEHAANAWTWPEFVSALRRVKPYAAIPLSLHMDEPSDEWFTYAFSPLIWSYGGRLIGADGATVEGVLNSDAAIDAVEKWQRLFQEGLADATSTTPNPFAAGLAAFDWTGHWMLPSFETTEGLRFGVMPLPRMGSANAFACGSWCWGLSRDCRDRQAAFEVIRWFLDPQEGIRPMVEANGAVPGRRSAFRFFPEFERMPRHLFREQLELAARPRPRTAVYLSLTSTLGRALRDIALGANVESVLAQAADKVQHVANRRRVRGG